MFPPSPEHRLVPSERAHVPTVLPLHGLHTSHVNPVLQSTSYFSASHSPVAGSRGWHVPRIHSMPEKSEFSLLKTAGGGSLRRQGPLVPTAQYSTGHASPQPWFAEASGAQALRQAAASTSAAACAAMS